MRVEIDREGEVASAGSAREAVLIVHLAPRTERGEEAQSQRTSRIQAIVSFRPSRTSG